MKRFFYLFIMLSAWVMLTGCMNNILKDEVFSPQAYIRFSSTTTRAAIADIETLQDDEYGFRVFATGGSNPSGWYFDGENSIDGMNNYHYSASSDEWDFVEPVKWPSDTTDYPMYFYAFHPSTPAGLSVTGDFNAGTRLTGVYTVQAAGSQTDLLAARAMANTQPATGYLTLTFRHILSRINFGIIAGTGTMPFIQSLQLVNVCDTRAYDFVEGDWVATTLSGNASYIYYPVGAVFTPVLADESTANLIYTGVHDHHLMLMPQTASSWAPQSGMTPTATSGGYISVIYRMSTGNATNGKGDPNEVGYADAAQHPDYQAMGGGVTGPLYVKAGFPLPSVSGYFTWEKGYSYLYNIVLGAHGSCNGYILDEYYYDRNGVRTGLKLREVRDEGKQTGDKLQEGTIFITLDIDNWDNHNGGDISPGTSAVTPRNIMLSYQAQTPATQSLTVTSLKANGAPDPAASWTLSVPDTQNLLRISFDPNASFATAHTTLSSSASSSSTGSHTVYIYATENTTDALRETSFFLDGEKAGNIYQAFNYNMAPGINNNPTDFQTYVGAFWRADETGERIIDMGAGNVGANYGRWTASVVWMDPRWGNNDEIVLSTDMTGADPNLYTENPGNAEDYRVESDDISISGHVTATDRRIVFRIGLKSKYTPTPDHPARYAQLLVSYADHSKHQIIYLRQGEEADYLFRNDDRVTTGGLSARTATARFSPYNLTADHFDTATDIQGDDPPVNPGKFTEFPTQAGAFFQWANAYYSSSLTHFIRARWAWNPYAATIPSEPEAVTWRMYAPAATVFWSSLAAEHETCPPGYRRPHDGSTTVSVNANNITNSELRQSLFLNPQTGFNYASDLANCMLGYYADGFFDRRKINNVGNAVAEGTGDVAYIGRLFYNPLPDSDHYGASLFLPYGGTRYYTTGTLRTDFLSGASYWTGSSDGADGISLRMMETHAGPWEGSKNFGYMIRCVKQ